MKWSQSHIFTLRDAPADAEITSHKLLVRGGFIKKLAPGIFTLQHLALRSVRKIEKIIREELDKRGCTEILMPMVQPQELWAETGRLGIEELLKFKNRNGHPFCLGATHEEVVTDIIRKDIKSYRDLPKNLYQIQTKYRDEIRPRFGLMRGREFIMKDAYSFDTDLDTAKKSYDLMYDAYKAIFSRLGFEFRIVEADAGNIGGSVTHEFQVLAESGEDRIIYCNKCEFAANVEVAPNMPVNEPPGPGGEMEEFDTPGLKTISDLAKALNVPEKSLTKTLFYADADGKPVCFMLRGSDEANPVKLKNALGMSAAPLMLTDDEVKALTGASPGSCGPVGLKIPIYLDSALHNRTNFTVGANRDDKHLRNVARGRDFKETKIVDIRMAQVGDQCPRCQKGSFKQARGIEVGHVFLLGTKYSKAMGATFLSQDGSAQPIQMGCYGIGVTRTMQAAVEQSNDKDGIIWPLPIAPFTVHMCVLDFDEATMKVANGLYQELEASGVDVLFDDREERPGVKFKDADLIGMPLRLTIGKRGMEAGELELTQRKTKETIKLPPQQVAAKVMELVKNGR
ncbi:MAG TPA: proline--tRNA ligase [Bdellovibrionales bacterium]|nr:proline--tRNA ligase [Bdellovibrionales bacterium]